jgi:hypothetical protein
MRVADLAFTVALAAVCLSGCDKPLACGDKVAVSKAPEAPHILTASIPAQLAQDTWTLVLAVDFSDPDADLADGSVVFYLDEDSDSATSQPLRPAFKQSALEESVSDGTLILPLRFDDGINDGTNVHLGLQLVDGASLRSNCYGLEIDFEVSRR